MTTIETPASHMIQTTVEGYVQPPPALWNPGVAGCWSLIFSPLFGAYLHMKNWEALGDPDRAKKSKNWAIGSFVFLTVVALSSVFLPDTKGVDAILRFSGFALVVSWYYSIGKFQQTLVVARFGKSYIRRGWTKPLVAAVLVLIAYSLLILVVAFIVEVVVGAA